MSSIDCENGRWKLQSHDLCGLRRGVLLALHERNQWSSLSQVLTEIVNQLWIKIDEFPQQFRHECFTWCFISYLQSFWLHFLGEKALVQKEENSLAARNSGRSTDWNRSCGWYCISCYDNRLVILKKRVYYDIARAYKCIGMLHLKITMSM